MWIRIGNNLINVNAIERITRVANDNWTVKMVSAEVFTNLTNSQVDAVLNMIGFSY